MPSKKIVILYSGGLDSAVMKKIAENDYPDAEVKCVYFDIGHEYAWKEKAALPPDVEVFDVSWLNATGVGKDGNAMASIFIPGRNMLLATMAAAKYLPDEIWLGALLGEIHDGATDKNLKFRDELSDLFTYVMSPFKGEVKLVYPFIDRNMDKFSAVEYALQHGMKEQILASSSCMSGEEGNCGRCGVCLRRAGIFLQLGLKEEYNVDPWTALENRDMIIQLIDAHLDENYSHYNRHRIREIVPALVKLYRDKSLEEIREIYVNLK